MGRAGAAVAAVRQRLAPAEPVAQPRGALARLAGDPDGHGTRPYPQAAGVWPGAVAVAAFAWTEAVASGEPLAVLLFIATYGLAQVAAGSIFGAGWFARGDGFEVYSGLLGRLSPLRRTAGGRLRPRVPGAGLTGLRVEPGLLAVVAVLIGANLFDGIAATARWQNLTLGQAGSARVASTTLGLAASVLLSAGVAAAGTPVRALRPALVPLVAAWAFAHYFAVLLIEGQTALAQLSDPLGRGWDVLGTAGMAVSYDVLPGAFAAAVRLVGFLAGHLLAVRAGDRLALARYEPRSARSLQVPLRTAVLMSLLGGLAVLFAGTA